MSEPSATRTPNETQSVSPQINAGNIARPSAARFKSTICNGPQAEAETHDPSSAIANVACKKGMQFAYCRSGARSTIRLDLAGSLHDACSMPSATTMAAARKRAAVVVGNALQTSMSKEPVAVDHGFGSCSLRIVSGRTSVAEFSYRGILLPSFPKRLIDGTRPSQLSWLIKDTIFAPVYRRGMPAGREWMAAPHMNGGEHA